MHPIPLLAAGGFAAAIALAAWRAHALTGGGALAAFAVGALTAGTLGVPGAVVLLAFFVPSVALSRLGRRRKRALVDIGKAGARDALQVLANGGAPTACALGAVLDPQRSWEWIWAFAGAYAAATADTWATEIGTLARQRPRSLFTLRPIPTGLSGGVTAAGTLAQAAGAVWIGIVAPLAFLAPVAYAVLSGDAAWPPPAAVAFPGGARVPTVVAAAAIPLAGFAGALLDSALGATVQELRRCEACERDCETDPHHCGARTRRVRGVRGLSNDAVNAAASVAGAAIAFALA